MAETYKESTFFIFPSLWAVKGTMIISSIISAAKTASSYSEDRYYGPFEFESSIHWTRVTKGGGAAPKPKFIMFCAVSRNYQTNFCGEMVILKKIVWKNI